MFVPLIKKNTPVPVTRSEVFYTAVDYQEAVEIKVYQGESEDALENIEVGRFMVEGLQEKRSGSEIIATFSLDTDSILHVSAREKDTGLEKSILIENVLSDPGKESLQNARNKVVQLFGDEDNTPVDKSSEDDQEDMIDLIEAIKTGLASGDKDAVQDSMDELSEIIFYLES